LNAPPQCDKTARRYGQSVHKRFRKQVDEVTAGDFVDLGVVFKTKFPKWESLKNKSGKSGMFFEPENRPSTSQLLPAIHHNFTTKTPRPTTHFRQNPQQKQCPTAHKK
jgi:hypothetical protein